MRIKPRRLAHRVTTAHLQAAYPFISEGGLGSEGVYIGRDVFGGSFCYDCFTLYGREIIGPNMLVSGQIGYAKSSLVKCLDEDTEIIDPVTGVPRTIAEVFKNEDVTRVLTLDQQRRITAAPIAAKVDVGLDSSCLRVTFASGRSVITTPEHPFLMPDGWRRADQLAVEETAAVPARIPFPEKPVRILDEEVDFLAIILAEGCYVRSQSGGVRFSSADPEIIARMRRAGERLGFSVRHLSRYDWNLTGHAKFTGPQDGTCACGCGAPTPIATRTRNGNVKGQPRQYADGHSSRRGAAATVLRRFGVPRALSREKVLPEVIYRLPPDQLARFIGVFWMCDGTVGQAGVSATLTSERLVRQLQHLVLRFGIQSKVRPHRSTLNGRPFPAWQLRVYSQSDQTFLSEILLWGTKRARLAALCAGRTRGVQAGVGAPSLPPAVRAPLDPMIGGDAQLALLRSIAAVMLGRNLRPEEDACLERAHHEAVIEANNRHAQPTIPQVVNRLLEPSDATAHELRGMFDGPTSSDLDLSGRLVVFNLREVKDEARPILMACTAAWLQGSWARSDGVRRIVVLDEAWVVLRHLAITRWLRESWKLARQYGVQNIAVMHRLSDLTAAGDAGSEQVQLAKGLLEDSETRVIYRQSPGEVEQARELLGLTQTECDQIPTLERGEALWRVGRRSFIVQHRIESSIEREIVDTDANMDPRPPPWAAGESDDAEAISGGAS